jgi:hypothetical protein
MYQLFDKVPRTRTTPLSSKQVEDIGHSVPSDEGCGWSPLKSIQKFGSVIGVRGSIESKVQ